MKTDGGDKVLFGLFSFILTCMLLGYGLGAAGKGCHSSVGVEISDTEAPGG